MNKIFAVVQFCFLEGRTTKEIHGRILPTLYVLLMSTLTKQIREFTSDKTNIERAPRPGGSRTATTPEIIDKDMVLANR